MAENRFTDDQLAMAKECGSAEELQELAFAEGVELADEDLDAVAGGAKWSKEEDDAPAPRKVCPSCGGDVEWRGPQKRYTCTSCGRDRMYPSDMKTV